MVKRRSLRHMKSWTRQTSARQDRAPEMSLHEGANLSRSNPLFFTRPRLLFDRCPTKESIYLGCATLAPSGRHYLRGRNRQLPNWEIATSIITCFPMTGTESLSTTAHLDLSVDRPVPSKEGSSRRARPSRLGPKERGMVTSFARVSWSH